MRSRPSVAMGQDKRRYKSCTHQGNLFIAGSDVHQDVVLLVLAELTVGSADLELWGGADAQQAFCCHGAGQTAVYILNTPTAIVTGSV